MLRFGSLVIKNVNAFIRSLVHGQNTCSHTTNGQEKFIDENKSATGTGE